MCPTKSSQASQRDARQLPFHYPAVCQPALAACQPASQAAAFLLQGHYRANGLPGCMLVAGPTMQGWFGRQTPCLTLLPSPL